MAGKIYETSKVVEKKWSSNCVIEKIDYCNSSIDHSENWCSLTFYFSTPGCRRQSIIGSTCKDQEGRGQCNNYFIKGNINKIDLFEGYWKNDKKSPIPSGFTVYTDKGNKYVFGAFNNFKDGDSRPYYKKKTWTGKGRITGVKYDTADHSDFMSFFICNKPSWWIRGPDPPVKGDGTKNS